MRADASVDEVARVRQQLLEANNHPEIVSLLEESALVGLAATPDDHCADIRMAMQRLSLRLDH